MLELYDVFGGRLESQLEFTELPRASSGPATWQLEVRDTPPLADEAEELGSDTVFGDVRVRCHRNDYRFTLEFDDTGRFDVLDRGGRLVWYRPADADEAAARSDIAGRVLALALHARGVLTLHASAVSIGGAGIAFVAPKQHGKSTLAAALIAAGARFITDDTLAVDRRGGFVLVPGVHHLRLWRDSAVLLPAAGPVAASDTPLSQKVLLQNLSAMQLESGTVPFAAAYVLVPSRPEPGVAPVQRERLSPVQAALELVAHAKLGPLLRGAEAGAVLTQAAEIAGAVPVYALSVQRDLSRIGEVASSLMAWHAGPAAPPHA